VLLGTLLGKRARRVLGADVGGGGLVAAGAGGSIAGATLLSILTSGGLALTPAGMLGALGGGILAASLRLTSAPVADRS
jgi:hypothetical protein